MEFVLIMCLCNDVLQLHISFELHSTGPMGHWICHSRQDDIANHPTEQVFVSGTHRWRAGRLVSGQGGVDELSNC